jgi:hypothetical protein
MNSETPDKAGKAMINLESDFWKGQPMEEKLRLMTQARESAVKHGNANQEAAWRYAYLREYEPVAVLSALGIEAGRNPDAELDAAIDKRRALTDEKPLFGHKSGSAEATGAAMIGSRPSTRKA